MPKAQAQYWDSIILKHRKFPEFLALAAKIRKSKRVSPTEYDRIYAAACREGRCSWLKKGAKRFLALQMPPDAQPVFGPPPGRVPRSPVAKFLAYRNRIKSKDLRRLRVPLNLSPAWDDAVRKFLLTGEIATLPFQTVGVRALCRNRRYDRLMLEVYRDSSIRHIVAKPLNLWRFRIAPWQKALRLRDIRCVARRYGNSMVLVEIGANTTRDDLIRLWSSRIKAMLPKLSGRPRLRVADSDKLEVTDMALQLRAEGQTTQQSLETIFDTCGQNRTPSFDTLRRRAQRLKAKRRK